MRGNEDDAMRVEAGGARFLPPAACTCGHRCARCLFAEVDMAPSPARRDYRVRFALLHARY